MVENIHKGCREFITEQGEHFGDESRAYEFIGLEPSHETSPGVIEPGYLEFTKYMLQAHLDEEAAEAEDGHAEVEGRSGEFHTEPSVASGSRRRRVSEIHKPSGSRMV